MSRRDKRRAVEAPGSSEFAIRVSSLDDLFNEFEAVPIAQRSIRAEVRTYLLDEWDRLRDQEPSTLTIHAPRADPAEEAAVLEAIRDDLRAASRPLRIANPLTRHDKIAFRIGIVFLFGCIAVSSALDRASEDVVVEGISQGILVLGWVALWRPAERFVTETVPHYFNRRRYAEFAEVEMAFEST